MQVPDGEHAAALAHHVVRLHLALEKHRIAVAVPTYSAWSASVGPGVNAVENGTMSGGIGAQGALVAVSARAGGDGNSYCRRDGRSKAMIDACLKNFANR